MIGHSHRHMETKRDANVLVVEFNAVFTRYSRHTPGAGCILVYDW
jgi:hypothetical protein